MRRQNNRLALAAADLGLALLGSKLIHSKGIDLHGRVVLITGSSRGLGLATAEEFARHGARLVICARDEQELERARQILTSQGAEVLPIPCDVTNQKQVQQLIDQATAHYGQIDIVVNNAGIISAGPVQTLTRSDFEESMNIIFWGTYNVTMTVLPQMLQRKSGRITNITSIGGKVSVPHLLSYSTAKFATVGFSEGLRAELARDSIIVTTIAPGLLRTGSHLNAIMKGNKHKEEYTAFTLLDTLPFTSISASKAAKQIVSATRRGSAEVVLSIQAQLLARFHGLFPGVTSDIMGFTNRFLPSGEGVGTHSYTGKESETSITRSFLTRLGQQAAKTYNEDTSLVQ
ncbi:MAG: SDR family oxidoreductase [Ktedonobacteraceae bacterium]